MPKLLGSQNMTGSDFTIPKMEGDIYEALHFRLTGTQAAAAFMSLGEIGRVIFNEHGFPVVDCDFDMLHFYNEIKGGDIECLSTGEANAQAFAYSAVIPRHFQDGVVEAITAEDAPQPRIKYFLSPLTNGIAAGEVELYGVARDAGIQKYRLKISQRDFIYSGAGTPTETIDEENVIGLYFDRWGGGPGNTGTKAAGYAVDADWTELEVQKDGKVFASGKVAALQAWSNLNNRVESTYNRLFEVDLTSEIGDITEQLSDHIFLKFRVAGAVTIRCLIVSADLTPDKEEATEIAAAETLKAKVQRKVNMKKTSVVKTLQLAAKR